MFLAIVNLHHTPAPAPSPNLVQHSYPSIPTTMKSKLIIESQKQSEK